MRNVVVGMAFVGLILGMATLAMANGEAAKPEIKEPVTVETVPVPAVSQGAAQRSPGLASFLSVLMPGLGQVYNGDIGKALIMGGVEGLCWVMISEDLDALGLFGMAMGRIISPVEAYYSALNKNKGLALEINKEKVLVAYKAAF